MYNGLSPDTEWVISKISCYSYIIPCFNTMCLRLIGHGSMLSGYFHFGNNHFFIQFTFLKNILQVLTDSWYTNTK